MEEPDDAGARGASDSLSLDDHSDDQGREQEGGEVKPQPSNGSHPRHQEPAEGQPDRLVDLLTHGAQTQRTGVEATIAEEVGHQDLGG